MNIPKYHDPLANLTEEEISSGRARLLFHTERDVSGVADANRRDKKEGRLRWAYFNLEDAILRVLKHTTNMQEEKKEILQSVEVYLKTVSFVPKPPKPFPVQKVREVPLPSYFPPPKPKPKPPPVEEWEAQLPKDATITQVANAFVSRPVEEWEAQLPKDATITQVANAFVSRDRRL